MSRPMLTIERRNDRVCYYLDGIRHRDDGPAIEYHSGIKMWYRYGVRHRGDGPAAIYPALGNVANPTPAFNCWYLNGVRYSEDEYNMITFFGGFGE